MSEAKSPAVYRAIAAVMAEMAKEGISKDRRSGDGGGPRFQFRGIDDVYNALAPVMSTNGLMMLPRMLSRQITERATKNGGAMFYTVVEAEFDLVASEDGSSHTIRTFGEAMDSSDKSTNKAMSAAFKYAAMQAFCIPTEGDNDADATTHEVVAKGKQETKQPTMQDRVEAVMQAAKNAKTSQEINAVYERSTGLRQELSKEERVKLEAFLVDRTAELDANNPFDKKD